MKLYRTSVGAIVQMGEAAYTIESNDWDNLINRDDLRAHLQTLVDRKPSSFPADWLERLELSSPVGLQEVWAAGVTYLRSRDARVEESRDAAAGDVYTRVYEAERPELFFKSTPHRVARPNGPMRLRNDSMWDVPEPEFTLYITSNGSIVAYTAGNDLSSRSIEGENPLYLPQAKTWDQSTSLGPCLYVPESPLPRDTQIRLAIHRAGTEIFGETATLGQMKRSFLELRDWLFRACTFPSGVFLMTGTCIVPPDTFTLKPGDEVSITIPPIGTLRNYIAGQACY